MKMLLIYILLAGISFIGIFIFIFILGLIFQALRKKTDMKKLISSTFGASLFFCIVITISGIMYLSDNPQFKEKISTSKLTEIKWKELLGDLINSQETVVERDDTVDSVTDEDSVVPDEQTFSSETNRPYPDRRPPDNRRPDQRRPDESRRGEESGNMWANRGSGDNASGADYVISSSAESIYTEVFEWKYKNSSLRRKKYKIAVELSVSNLQAAQDYLDKINRLYYAWNRELFQEVRVSPSADTEEVYAAMCQAIFRDDEVRFDEIIDGFQSIFEAESMSDLDQLYFVITMLQNVEYQLPGDATDILPPTICLAENYGDCDTKSMLGYVILDELGFDVVMMASQTYAHAMLGVNATASGDYLEYEGKRYYFVEMTYPDWWLGELDSSCGNPRYWYAFKLDV